MGALTVWMIITYLVLCVVAGEWDREGGLATMHFQAAGPLEPVFCCPSWGPTPTPVCVSHVSAVWWLSEPHESPEAPVGGWGFVESFIDDEKF